MPRGNALTLPVLKTSATSTEAPASVFFFFFASELSLVERACFFFTVALLSGTFALAFVFEEAEPSPEPIEVANIGRVALGFILVVAALGATSGAAGVGKHHDAARKEIYTHSNSSSHLNSVRDLNIAIHKPPYYS